MGMLLNRDRGAPPPPRNPASVPWATHQSALVELTKSYESKLQEARAKSVDVDVLNDPRVLAKIDEATEFMSKAASENEALAKQVSELQSEIAALREKAEAKADAPSDDPSPKTGRGRSGNRK